MEISKKLYLYLPSSAMFTRLSNLLSPVSASEISIRDGFNHHFHQSITVKLSLRSIACAGHYSITRNQETKDDAEDELIAAGS
jgi:hypothetical protein